MNKSGSGVPKGCLIGCGGLLGAVIIFIMVVYYIVFHTAMPVKSIVNLASEDFDLNGKNTEAKFINVGGSLSSGITIEEAVFYDKNNRDQHSRVENLTFRYSGLWDLFINGSFVIEELSADKMDLIVSDGFFKADSNKSLNEDSETENSVEFKVSDEANQTENKVSFELQKMQFKNTRIRSVDGELDIAIPLVYISGLKILGDDFRLNDFKIISDYVNFNLVNSGNEQTEEGNSQTYRVQGEVLPQIHAFIKNKISFSIDIPKNKDQSNLNINLFGDKLHQSVSSNGDAVLKINALGLSNYIDFGDKIVPDNLTMEMQQSGGEIKVNKGEFSLGESKFSIPEQNLSLLNFNAEAIKAYTEIDNSKIEARFKLSDAWPFFQVFFNSDKNLSDKELLAQVYFQSSYMKLKPDDKKIVDNLKL